MEMMVFDVVVAAEQERARVAASRADRRDDAESSFVFRDVRAALFFAKLLNLDTSFELSWLQAARAVPTSSSYFLHFPKVAVQFFNALAKFFADEDKSQDLMVLAVVTSVPLAQHVHAADPVFLRHPPVMFLNVVIALLHFSTSVVFG